MRFTANTASDRTSQTPNASIILISDWASRVMGLWEQSRRPQAAEPGATAELGSACLVRDALNNRLERSHEDSAPCPEQSLRTLRDADALFKQFTVESTTAGALSAHNHYAHRSEWWWRRLPRQRVASAA
jgi:hypothetical protein